ncbi:MAG: Homocysteine S-methyltransferase [Alphaproteobacteria bacterium MarineAlpha2_Bin1]|nr:MAG: Homocysteine S-methyltransferase [Alphaproteobacteria bacterium MarineAlpha2_Bin1]
MEKIALLDGGMGQELLLRSKQKPHPMWSAKVLLDEPQIVEDVHCDFIQAGSRIITLNSYALTPERLKRDSSLELFEPLQNRAMSIANRSKDKTISIHNGDLNIAGCLPPLTASYRPETAPGFNESIDQYYKIASIQANNVDFFLCETMSSIIEAKAAITAAKIFSKPIWISFSINDDNTSTLRSGEKLFDGIKEMKSLNVDAVLINCSIPEAIDSSIQELKSNFSIIGAYANGFTSINALLPGGTVDSLEKRKDLNPEKYSNFAINWVKLGAKIIGGCCEVGPRHISKLKENLINNGFQISSNPS